MTSFESAEAERLEAASSQFSTLDGFEGRVVGYGFESIKPFLQGASCLELGPADGHMTGKLIDMFDNVTVVDGSNSFCDLLRERHQDVASFEVVCSLFENYTPAQQFDTIIAAHVLEHVDDPTGILRHARDWLAPGGRLIVQVPNARSFHRLLGVKLGQLQDVTELNERDHLVGHRRVYDADLLRKHLAAGGWNVDEIVGSYFKMFSNAQSEQWFSDELVHAIYELGKDFPENGTMISAVCTPA